MSTRATALTLSRVGALVAGLLALSCGGGGGSPSTPTGPSTPVSPTVTSVSVAGPGGNVEVGQSTQFTATAHYSNGTTQSCSGSATWQSSNTAVATVSPSGMVSAVGVGTADIRATFQTVAGSATVSVVRPVTYALSGYLKDASNNAGISGATIRILDGANAGKSTSTDSRGYYLLSKLIAGTFMIRASHASYETTERSVTITNANRTFNFTARRKTSPPPSGATCGGASVPSSVSCGKPTARCKDGTWSCSEHRSGTCSWHGGVACWVCPGLLCSGLAPMGGQCESPAFSTAVGDVNR